MKKPMLSVKLELWESSHAFLNHGIPWYERIGMFLFNRDLYRRIHKMRTGARTQIDIRGFYDRFHDKIILCTKNLEVSSLIAMNRAAEGGIPRGDYHKVFGLQFYYTLVHEMIHKMNVTKDDTSLDGHDIDGDKMDDLPDQLRDIFDGLLDLEDSNDNFGRNKNGTKIS